MSTQDDQLWGDIVRETAAAFPYPVTPNIADGIGERLRSSSERPARRLRLVMAATLCIFIIGLISVPTVRGGVLEWLQIGSVRVQARKPTPAPTVAKEYMVVTATPQPVSSVTPRVEQEYYIIVTATPIPTPVQLNSVLDLAGETTLVDAQAQVDFPITLPDYPADLGQPDRVYLQDIGGPAVVLVWLAPDQNNAVRLSLHLLAEEAFALKMMPEALTETRVSGERALWMAGPYVLHTRESDFELVRLIDGHVLVWTVGAVTYRLETDLPLAEALQIAESLE